MEYLCNEGSNSVTILQEEPRNYPPEPKDDEAWVKWLLDHPVVILDREREHWPWVEHAEELARWTMERLVVRDDAYGIYYYKDDKLHQAKKAGDVTLELVANHFRHDRLESIIGLYTTSDQDECKVLTVDLDRHHGDPQDLVDKNLRFALDCYRVLEERGFHPLLIDSNGAGGLHLRALFDCPVTASQVRALGLWLARAWEAFDLPKMPEVFPKQDSISGKYGNFVRLFGRHPKRACLSRVWDGNQWQVGEKAIQIILSRKGDPASLIPQEALDFHRPQAKRKVVVAGSGRAGDEWWKAYAGDLRTLD